MEDSIMEYENPPQKKNITNHDFKIYPAKNTVISYYVSHIFS